MIDVETIAVRQRDGLDWAYIEAHLRPLVEMKEQPQIMDVCFHLRQGSWDEPSRG